MASSVFPAGNRRSSKTGSATRSKIVALHGEVWETVDFIEIEAAIGSAKALRLLRAFVARLDDVSYTLRLEKPEGHEIKMLAHDLKAISGQLGFQALAHFCQRMMIAKDIDPTSRRIRLWLNLIHSSTELAEAYCAAHATPRPVVER